MGYERHNAIVITSWNKDQISAAVDYARSIGLQVLGPSEPAINAYRSALICPDGSKEGWEDSDSFDEKRDFLKQYLRHFKYGDGSSSMKWVEIAYGSDDKAAWVVDSQWQCRKENE